MDLQIISGIEGELNLEKWFQKGGPGSGHHGHKGRKGKRGGSLPSKGVAAHKLSAPVGDIGVVGNQGIGDWMSKAVKRPGHEWEDASQVDRAELKAQVARDLAEASGVTEQEAADFVRQWAHSSNGNDMRSLAIQQDAAKEFGTKISEFTQGQINARDTLKEKTIQKLVADGETPEMATKLVGAAVSFHPLMESDRQRALLRAMYNETQAELKARGIKEVRLSRGIGFPIEQTKYWEGQKGKSVSIETNTLESWSVSRMVAGMFAGAGAGGKSKGDIGVVLEAVVPAERILSMPATGFGCLTEGEVIILGGVEGDIGYVSEYY